MNKPKLSTVLDQLRWRLPSEIRPKHYNLLLHPDLKTKTFTGKVSIQLEVQKPINFIAIHTKFLNISHTNLQKLSTTSNTLNVSIPIFQTFEHASFEYWVAEIENPLDVGEYTLGLTFNGSLTDRIVGFYQSSYFDKNRNQTRYIATSKFEPTYARQAFPCFDEPAMKATFKVSLIRPTGDGYSALSNMNEESSVDDPDTKLTTVHFAESVQMSTYLACFIVSDFLYKKREINAKGIGNNFDLRVFATPAQLDKVDFAMETGARITEYYIDYFRIPYPLPKLDMVAIPDFVSGAMEHWGLVTFRETALLYDDKISASDNRQRVGIVIAHEIAHMWFGNLVTMDWWNDLWLNEGFASYMEYKGTDAAYPEWKMADQFLTTDLHSVLSFDASLASHPIVQPANNPDQITELFDTITYSKGASVIRMLEDFVGAENFRKSVTNYLNAHKYGNAVTNDLLGEIEKLNLGFDVKYIMSTWTRQTGYPVVNVIPVSGTRYKLTQKRFLSNPDDENATVEPSEFNYRWTIPITYITDKSELKRMWFNNVDNEIEIDVPANHKWLKLNKDQFGYYRVNYPQKIWQSLADALKSNVQTFSISDRAHLLNDTFSLAEATQLPYDVALELSVYLRHENDFVPWNVASSKIRTLKNWLHKTEYYSCFEKYAQNVVKSAYEKVGWTVDKDHLKNLLRTTILNLACTVQLPESIQMVGALFDDWIKNPDNRPQPDWRETIYKHGMATVGNVEKWDKMWQLYLNESDAQEKSKLLNGLSGIREPWLLKRFIDLAWDEQNVRRQDYFACMQQIASNKVGESLVWDYVRENWPKYVERFGLNERYLGSMIPSITGRFNSETKLQEVLDFFAKYPEAGAGAAARQRAIAGIKSRIKWLENNKDNVGTWLKRNYSN